MMMRPFMIYHIYNELKSGVKLFFFDLVQQVLCKHNNGPVSCANIFEDLHVGRLTTLFIGSYVMLNMAYYLSEFLLSFSKK